jgi:predicted nucleotidyltransferase
MNATCANVLPEIVDRLKVLRLHRVILFGSNAGDAAREDSDIDLVVVLDTREVPGTYDQKIELKLQVRATIGDLSLRVPIDLLVYTRPEYDALLAQRSSFSRALTEKGRVLYAKAG